MRKFRLMMTLLALITTMTAWADNYTVNLTSEFKAVPTIYAGCQNYLTLEVTSNEQVVDVVAQVFADGMLIETIPMGNFMADETITLPVVDQTIRPIAENTVYANDNNEDVTYKVVIKEGEVEKESQEFPFVILYNGNLGKDYEYPVANPGMRQITFTGDVKVMVQEAETFMNNNATSREDAFAVELNGGSVNKAFLYVAYNWDKVATGDFKTWTTTFNGTAIEPIADYRDQMNLGTYGGYGYGLVVYDVTDLVAEGNNTFALEKTAGNASVYPSQLTVLINDNDPDADLMHVYIYEEADLLSKTYNQNTEASFTSKFEDVAVGDHAKLYVFAAGAQAGEGNLEINGYLYEDVWNGTSQSLDVHIPVIPDGDITAKFISTGSSILALHQMLVVIGDDPSGIEELKNVKIEGLNYYDLQGRRVANPTKGVYIVNGKKVIKR